jgi:hypothetical protein
MPTKSNPQLNSVYGGEMYELFHEELKNTILGNPKHLKIYKF